MTVEAATGARFRVAAPHVIHQSIDGEVVLIHLEKGTYHSLRGSGARVFPLLEGGVSSAGLARALAAAYEGEAAAIEAAAARFLEDLRRDGLVVEVGTGAGAGAGEWVGGGAGSGAGPEIEAGLELAGAGAARPPFEAPRVESFSDLQDLILADPIHEVEPSGWPNVTPGGRAT